MIAKIDLLDRLQKIKTKDKHSFDMQSLFDDIVTKVEYQNKTVLERLQTTTDEQQPLNINIDLVNKEDIFHIDQIEKLCLDYRLRFLSTTYFKGTFPTESIQAIKEFEAKHQTQINTFKIIAPSKLFQLENTDDPILFADMGNNYYYFLHKWGDEMNPLRKLRAWPLKSFKNLSFVLLTLSTLLTALTYPFFLKENASVGYLICLWLFYVKGIFGVCLYLGVASGKSFTKYCWQSRFDKI